MIDDVILSSSSSRMAPPTLREMVRGRSGGWRVGRILRACVGTAARIPLYTSRSSTST